MSFGALRSALERMQLPALARAEARRDAAGLPEIDPQPPAAIDAMLRWLVAAQDNSSTDDGGVARHFSLIDGWSASYPETTGYLVPTLLESEGAFGALDLEERARRMLDWLVDIQLPSGAFQGGMVDQEPVVPVTFNTGQILLGLAAGVRRFGAPRYAEAMRRAARWLVDVQDADGAWTVGRSPFARPGVNLYETHVAWGLLEAARVEENESWATAALANIDWAIGRQHENGWFPSCCLTHPSRPLTHTIGYTLRGILEGYRFSGDEVYLDAARRTADALLTVQRPDGSLPGRLDDQWKPAVEWSCLTGNSQIAAVWLLLPDEGGKGTYEDAARRLNAMVRRTIRLDGPPGVAGGVRGSFPIDGGYGRFQMLNWAAKFTIDANLLELQAPDGTGQMRDGTGQVRPGSSTDL